MVHIESLHCRLQLPSGMQSPLAVPGAVERIASSQLPRTCARHLKLPEDDQAVYRIRELRLKLWLDVQNLNEFQFAEQWGNLLARAIQRAIANGPNSQIAVFSTPQEFITSFLRDLVTDRAWQLWYYEEFQPLRNLSVGELATQLLVMRPGWIVPVFSELGRQPAGERLIQQLNHQQIQRVWSALDLPSNVWNDALDVSPNWQEVVAAFHQLQLERGSDPDDRARDSLRLWRHLVASSSQPDERRSAAVASLVVEVAALLDAYPELRFLLAMQTPLDERLTRALSSGPFYASLKGLKEATQDPSARPRLAGLVDELTRSTAQSEPTDQVRAEDGLTSPVGGAALLLPVLLEVNLWELWVEEYGPRQAGEMIGVCLLKALGRRRATLHLPDRLLARVSGLSEPLRADNRVPPDAESRASWTDHLPEIVSRFYTLDPAGLAQTTIEATRIISHLDRDFWVATGSEASAALLSFPAEPPRSPTLSEHPDSDRIRQQFDYLRLTGLGVPWLSPSLDVALSGVTTFLTRRLAKRLPGMERCGLRYLSDHFFAQPARLKRTNDQFQLTLSPGPVGRVVLALADLPKTIHLPWLKSSLQMETE